MINRKTNEVFGVEITELFINQSSERIKNIHNYVSNIINGKDEKRYADKEDIENLPVAKIYVKNRYNQYDKVTDAVKVPIVTIEKYIDKIKKIIKTKSDKNYRNKCEKVELFINDTEEFFYDKDVITMNKFVCNKDLVDQVKNSIFSTVYILTKYNKEDVIITVGKVNLIDTDKYEVIAKSK
ncbi:MAG: hypothetical protein ACLUD1_09610 [Clostridia bacterium]